VKYALICFFAAILVNAADDRITEPVDSNHRIALHGHVHPATQAGNDQGALAPDAEISYVALLLKPAAGLEIFLAEQQNPSSPEYRRWLTPEQFAERFGLTASDTGKIAAWLGSEGLTVHDVARGRHWITFSGTAQTMGRALNTQFHRYNVNGGMHFANTSEPEIPAALASVVAGFVGLNDLDIMPASRKSSLSPENNIGTSHYLVPDDVATIYNIAPLYKAGIDGTGQSIAVVGEADINLADIRSFRKRFNLPAKDPKIVLVGPDPGTTNTGAVEEADLDLEWSGAIAPNATIIYVNARSVTTSTLYAIDQNLAPVLSESFSGCERASQPGLRAIAQQANAQGITWIVASGDQGAATCDAGAPNQYASKGLGAGFPSSIPEVTAMGGTTLNDIGGNYWAATNGPNLGSALGYIPEIVMNDSAERHELFSAGSGASAFFPKPVWQTGPGVPQDNARDVPDIALAASPDHHGFEVVTFGTLAVFGGTSLGTPVFAGVTALLNQYLVSKGAMAAPGLGNINPNLYRLAQATTDVFHDITTGDNKVPCEQGSPDCIDGLMGYAAGPGYDLATGLGSIDANALVTKWTIGTASTTSLTANPTKFGLGDKIQLTATVTGAGKVAPTGTVTFVSNDVVVGTGTLAAGSVSVSADGLLVGGGSGKIVAEYSGDAVYNASGATVSVALNLPASGSLVVPSVTPNPVFQSATNWPYTLRLDEKAGVATKLTAFTVNGVNNINAFTNLNIPAHGSISASLAGNNVSVPLDRVYHFTGTDTNGRTWTQDLTVPFVGPAGPKFVPAMTLSSVPQTVQSNPQADRTCSFSQQLVVQETTGFYNLLEQFTVGSTDLTGQIQQIFGTDRLAPFGTLMGTVCWPSNTAPGAKNYQLLGVTEIGTVTAATVNTTLMAGTAQPSFLLSVTPRIVEMIADSSSRTGSATIKIALGGSPQWTVSVVPDRASNWLTVSPLSGSGAAELSLRASGAALSNGVYDATLVIQSTNAVPQAAMVRVVFAVGPSFATIVDSVSNAAASNPLTAPGAMVRVTGSNLARSKKAGTIVFDALSPTLDGVSATVNGIAAPLYSIAPGELVLQVPYETTAGPAVLGINNNGQIAAFVFQVNVAAPELFKTANGFLAPTSTASQGQTIAAFMTGDGDVTPFLQTGGSPTQGTTAADLPGPGLPVSVKVGALKAPVTFAGIVPGLVGVTQFNFTVPLGTPVGIQPVVVTVGGVASGPASVRVTAAPGK
jgi:uncharacterized protein (TIGR03437 family)